MILPLYILYVCWLSKIDDLTLLLLFISSLCAMQPCVAQTYYQVHLRFIHIISSWAVKNM